MTTKHPETLLSALTRHQEARPDQQRPYLGGSIIGANCLRQLYYGFRGYPKIPISARVRRIFDLGHKIEDQIVSDLKALPGVTFWDRDPKTGKQFSVSTAGGFIKGHFDGVIRAPDYLGKDPLLVEIKSMKSDGPMGFQMANKHGIARAHSKYYAQVQTYLHLADKLRQCLFVAYDKNTSDVYMEIIDYDPIYAAGAVARGVSVVEAEEIPERIADAPGWWECRFCDFRKVCWEGEPVPVEDCRQCKHAIPDIEAGKWICRNPASLSMGREASRVCEEFEGEQGHVYEGLQERLSGDSTEPCLRRAGEGVRVSDEAVHGSSPSVEHDLEHNNQAAPSVLVFGTVEGGEDNDG